MTIKDHIFRILLLLVLAAAGFLMVSVTVNLLIYFEGLNSETVPQGFLEEMVTKASIVWMGACIAGVISLFIKQSWRITLLLCPLILPSLFIIIFTLTQT